MSDLESDFECARVPLDVQINWMERSIAKSSSTYQDRVIKGTMTQSEACEILRVMGAVLDTLKEYQSDNTPF